MPTSSFTIYTSEDRDGPGPITGFSGSLISILNSCLINGYGTGSYYKAPAGWLKPCPDTGSNVGLYPLCFGAWQQPSGSGFSFYINDNYPSGVTVPESWLVGWQNISSSFPAQLLVANSASVGSGIGQFPTPSQQGSVGTFGAVIIRKSVAVNNSPRSWMIAADAYTIYMWLWSGDITGVALDWGFGDFYSLVGLSDKGRCFMYGKHLTGATVAGSVTDCISAGPSRTGLSWNAVTYNPMYGHYIANSISGFGGSIWANKKGDIHMASGGSSITTNYGYQFQDGIYSFPQPYDNSMRLSPLWIGDPNSISLRGKYRGLYQPLHYATSFQNGQLISGSGNLSGKVFMMVEQGTHGGHWALEISNTVETN